MIESSPAQRRQVLSRSDSRLLTGSISAVIAPAMIDGKSYEIMLDIIEDAVTFYFDGETSASSEFMIHAQNIALHHSQEVKERTSPLLPLRRSILK